MELHTLLNEEELTHAQFTVWLYFIYKTDPQRAGEERQQSVEMDAAAREVAEELDLQPYGDRVQVVYQHRGLLTRLQVESDSSKSKGCLCT